MEIKLYLNQRTNGGVVDWDKWELFTANGVERVVYGAYSTIAEITVEIPENWSVGVDSADNAPTLYDSDGYPAEIIEGDNGKIYAFASTSKYPVLLKTKGARKRVG